ncbi:MAG: hypothetical protein JO222_07500 [Frankiales bacterium]|nr:hypothetical protein [Frankiales bacterium]
MDRYRPVLIGVLVLTEVAIWQWRMVIAHRGRRTTAFVLGVIGAALQITAISQVVADIHDVVSIAAYAAGVGCGVLFGLIAGERLTPGRLEVSIISDVPSLTEHLWLYGWPATAVPAHSERGPVIAVAVEVERSQEQLLREHTANIDPRARVLSKEIRPSPATSAARPRTHPATSVFGRARRGAPYTGGQNPERYAVAHPAGD